MNIKNNSVFLQSQLDKCILSIWSPPSVPSQAEWEEFAVPMFM